MMINKELPEVVQNFAERYPEVWQAYNNLGKMCAKSGPLDAPTQRLIKLAIAAGAGRQGAVHSHARQALREGLSEEELLQVALLAITTIGWSGAFAAVTWIMDCLPAKG